MKKYSTFMAEAVSAKKESNFKEMAKQAIKASYSKDRVDSRIQYFEKMYSQSHADEILEILPVNREKLMPAMQKKGIHPVTDNEEAMEFLVNALSTKGGWKRFSSRTLDLG